MGLSQLREQIFALNDQLPGGFDTFRSAFHRLDAEIVATVYEFPIESEKKSLTQLSEKASRIDRMGVHQLRYLKTQSECTMVGDVRFRFNLPDIISSERIDPYGEAINGLLAGRTPVAANNVTAATAVAPNQNDRRNNFGKGQLQHPRDSGGKKQKTKNAISTSETSSTTQM